MTTPASPVDSASDRTHPLLGERVYHGHASSGMQVWVCPRPGSSVSLHLLIEAGALDQGAHGAALLPAGTAHFLEHRLFEKQDGDLSAKFAALGAEIDAETGYTHTSFTCTTPPQQVEACLHLLGRLALEPYFPTEGIIREREIIQREIELYQDNVDWVAYHAAVRALYPDQPIASDIAGTQQSLAEIDSQVLERAHELLYDTRTMHLIVTGPIEPAVILDVSEQAIGVRPVARGQRLERTVAQPAPRFVQASLAVPRPRMLLGIAADPATGNPVHMMRRELHQEWLLDILLGGASPFYTRFYESALLDGESFGSEICVDEPFSFCLVGGDTDDPDQLGAILLAVLNDPATPDRIRQDADRARRKAYGDLVTSFEHTDSVREFIESACVRGCHPFELADLFLNTGAEDLIATWEETLYQREAARAVVGTEAGAS